MQLYLPRMNPRVRLNRLWAQVRSTWIAPYLSHPAHANVAAHLVRRDPVGSWINRGLARCWFDRPLQGAGYAWQSRMPLVINEGETVPVTVSGANGVDFDIFDFATVLEIGLMWTTTGTVTAMVMDFDLYDQLQAGGSVTDKLDGTNGVITSPTVASQAAGNVLFKDIGDTIGGIDLTKGHSINAIVTTTTSAGAGVPYVLVIPRDETNTNLTTEVISS